jgi:hypothetical protein
MACSIRMSRWLLLIALAACVSESGREPEPVRPRPPAVEPTPLAPKPPAVRSIELAGFSWARDAVCLHRVDGGKECVAITWDIRGKQLARGTYDPTRGAAHEFLYNKQSCKLVEGTLACDGAAPIAGVEQHATRHYSYLRAGDRVWWYENWLDIDVPGAGETQVLRDVKPFPKGIKQLAVAFRASCALAGDDSVWCWSDPRSPKRATVPAGTVEIFVQEPFELCARTAAGSVSCSPALAPADLACNKLDRFCGRVPFTAEGDQLPMRDRFDPLTSLLRPQAPIELGHAATKIVRDDTELSMHCRSDHKVIVEAKATGGCAVGPAGEVTCFTPCGKTWDTFRITGMAAISELWLDDKTAYARTANGTLYAWPNPAEERQYAACTPRPDVAARQLTELPGVTQLTAPLAVLAGPNWYEEVRCAVITGGGVRCWRSGPDGWPTQIIDPRDLPVPAPLRP